MITFELLHPKTLPQHLGLIPSFFSQSDPRSAKEQIHERYAHGGWLPMAKWHWDPSTEFLTYPGTRSLVPIARATLHDKETIYIYPHAWVCIVQPDGTYEVTRAD